MFKKGSLYSRKDVGRKFILSVIVSVSLFLTGCAEYLALELAVASGQMISKALENNDKKNDKQCPGVTLLKTYSLQYCLSNTSCSHNTCKNWTIKIDDQSNNNVASKNTSNSLNFSPINTKIICERATKSDGSAFKQLSNKYYGKYVQEAWDRGYSLYKCNLLTGRNKPIQSTQNASSTNDQSEILIRNSPSIELESFNKE